MATRQNIIHQIIHQLETFLDRLRYRYYRRSRQKRQLIITAYHGIGNTHLLQPRGRVLVDHGIPGNDSDSFWSNLRTSYRRFETDEVPDIRVRAEFQGKVHEVSTDEEGYFTFTIQPDRPLDTNQAWQTIRLSLAARDIKCEPVEGKVMIAAANCRFGIISDMDDTVLVTNATMPLKAMYLTFLENVKARVPFTGVAAFYRALIYSNNCNNPIYYVSSSPWNLYEMLLEFMQRHEIPDGPLMLRDIGIDSDKFIASSHGTHKREQIVSILELNPGLNFILIGDSGQHDPEIYRQIAQQYPERIQVIYIRDVTQDKRDAEVKRIGTELAYRDIPMVYVADSISAAEDAASRGLIDAASLQSLRIEQLADKTEQRQQEIV